MKAGLECTDAAGSP